MKKFILIFFIIPVVCFSQDSLSGKKVYQISQTKLSQFFFQEKIESFRTSIEPDFISLKSDGNALFVQLMDLGVTESNIVVKTTDGLFYDLTILPKSDPDNLSFFVTKDMAVNVKNVEVKEGSNINYSSFSNAENSVFEKILSKKGYMRTGNIVRVQKVSMILKGIYVDKENIYFRLLVDNKSRIGYHIESVNFFVSEKTSSELTSTDNAPVNLLKNYNQPKMIDGGSDVEIIFCFKKFTIDLDKKFIINMIESNGDRTMNLNIYNEQFSEARTINY